MSSIPDNQKLLIIPGACDALGGTLVTLIEVAKGFRKLSQCHRIKILVQANSLAEKALVEADCHACIESIEADSLSLFAQRSLAWVEKQPITWPLLLDNWTWKGHFWRLIVKGFSMRFRGRAIYHFCHDLSLSRNPLGFLARKVTFACLSPNAICNSNFTASYVKRIMPKIKGILYQPVDLTTFNSHRLQEPPEPLKQLVEAKCRIILTPSRLSSPGGVNDKNLRSLIAVLSKLKASGQNYHSVIIGEDKSEGKTHTRTLLHLAEKESVAEQLTILPPTLEIERYYQWSDAVLTLAFREPFGRTIVEAIACGIPVIGSQSGGIKEILQNFAPEWTVDPYDSTAAAEALVQVINSPATPAAIAKGQRWIEDNCSVETYIKGLMRLTELTPANYQLPNRQTSLTASQ